MISGVSRTYGELEVGAVYRSRHGRTVLEADNVWFTLLTLNTNPIHFDAEYAATTEWGRPLVDSTFTLALVTGLSVADVSERGINLGWREVRLQSPVFAGDTIRAETEVLAKRESQSRPAQAVLHVLQGFDVGEVAHRHRPLGRPPPHYERAVVATLHSKPLRLGPVHDDTHRLRLGPTGQGDKLCQTTYKPGYPLAGHGRDAHS